MKNAAPPAIAASKGNMRLEARIPDGPDGGQTPATTLSGLSRDCSKAGGGLAKLRTLYYAEVVDACYWGAGPQSTSVSPWVRTYPLLLRIAFAIFPFPGRE